MQTETVLKEVYNLIDSEIIRLSKKKEFKRENEVAGNQLAILKMKIDKLDLFQKERLIIASAVTYGNRQDCYDATETLGVKYFSETFKND